MSTTSMALMTAEEFMELPDDGFRYELINGEVIRMRPPGIPHGRITLRLMAPLAQFVWDHDLGDVYDQTSSLASGIHSTGFLARQFRRNNEHTE